MQEAALSAHGDADPKSTQVSYRYFFMTFVTKLTNSGFQETALISPFRTTLVTEHMNSASQETTPTFPPSSTFTPSPTQPLRHMSTKARRARLRAQTVAREIAVLHRLTQRLRQKHTKLIRQSLGQHDED